jgi:hypothetical protein
LRGQSLICDISDQADGLERIRPTTPEESDADGAEFDERHAPELGSRRNVFPSCGDFFELANMGWCGFSTVKSPEV